MIQSSVVGRRGVVWRIARFVAAYIVFGVLVALLMATASGQPVDRDGPPGTAPSYAAAPGGAIQYVGPDTYILLDAEGRPQPMPGMTYEDFMAAWKRSVQVQVGSDQPRFTIESLEIRGQAQERHAQLQIEIVVRLLTAEPVVVPLRLADAILREQPRFQRTESREGPAAPDESPATTAANRPTEPFLDFDPERGGYFVGLTGEPGERHTLTLEVAVPLVHDGAETSLELNGPRALVATLSLDVPLVVADAASDNGANISQTATDDGQTRLSTTGRGGRFRLSWTSAAANQTDLAAVLSATGAIAASIDGHSVQTDARLSVRSHGGSFDRFRVRLPAGAQLVPPVGDAQSQPRPNYRLTVENDTTSDKGRTDNSAAQHQIVLVELPEKQAGPVEVRIVTEQPLGLQDFHSVVDLSGFDVIGAVRQFGDIALRVADDWQLRWEPGRFVRQVDPSDLAPALQQPGLSAAFHYDRQPWSLGLRIDPRRFRVHAVPSYELTLLPDEARLRVHLAYQVLGARAFEFRVDLKDWLLTADAIESGGLVDRDRVLLTREGILQLPLTQAASRRAEVVFTVRRRLPPGTQQIRLPMPMPVTESTGVGELLVHTSPGIELMPDLTRSVGLAAVPVAENGADDAVPLRFRCFLPDAVLTADRIARSRDVAAELNARVDAGTTAWNIEQRIDYHVRHQQIAALLFDVPGDLPLDDGQIEFVLVPHRNQPETSEPLAVSPLSFVAALDDQVLSANVLSNRVRVTLPQPRLGRFGVVVRYSIDPPPNAVVDPSAIASTRRSTAGAAAEVPFAVPLVQPTEVRLAQQRVAVRAPRQTSVRLDSAAEDAWQATTSSDAVVELDEVAEFYTAGSSLILPLILGRPDPTAPSATSIEQIWLQTWMSNDVRQTRAAFRFRSSGSFVAIELPPGTPPQEVEVLVDGQSADVARREEGRLLVRLNTNEMPVERNDSHTLELRYRQPQSWRLATRQQITPPQLAGTTALSEVFWQIVLPGDQHLIGPPDRLAPATRWQWLGSHWGPRATKSQAELEQWVGASTGLMASAAQSEYLFSGVAPLSSIEVIVAPRWLIVLTASGAVLALALAWVYLPVVRRGWIVLALAALLAALAAAYPAPAVLIGQAALLGLVLAAVALVLGRLLARPTPWTPPASGSSYLRQHTPRSDSFLLSASASGSPTTATARAADSER